MMSASTDKVSSYGRQVSDTFFYDKTKRDRSREKSNGHRTLSFTEPEWKIRNGSVKNRYCGFNITNETSRGNFIKRLKSEENGQINLRQEFGYYNNPDTGSSSQRSENVVRFHENIITDVHEGYRHKIQVDNLEPSFPEKDNLYETEVVELKSPRFENNNGKHLPNKSRHRSASSKFTNKQDNQQNILRKSSETCFGIEGGVAEKSQHCENNHKSGTDTKRQTVASSSDKGISKSRNGNDSKHRSTSSKKRATSTPNATENCSGTKSPVRKSQSSSSTRSSQNDKKAGRTQRHSKSSADPQTLLTKSNSNGYTSRPTNTSADFAEKVILAYPIQDSDKVISTKKRKVCCVLCAFIVTVVIVVAVTTGLVFSVGGKASTEGAVDSPRVYDMLNVHVRLKVLNENYTAYFQNNSSPHFNRFSVQMCNEIDVIYITSHMSQNYYGCKVVSLRSGSVRVYYMSPFLDRPQTSNISYHREILLNNLRSIFSPSLPVNTTVLGDFVVDVNSIEISIEKFQTTTLPQKPRLPFRGTSTLSTSTVLQESQPSTLSTSTNAPSSEREVVSEKKGNNVINNTVYTTKMSRSTTMEIQEMTTSEVYSQTNSITDQNRIISTSASTYESSITATNESVYLDKQPARIEFFVNNSRNLVALIIRHENFRGKSLKLKELSELELGNQGKIEHTFSAERTLLVNFSENSIKICLEFKTVTCDDVGIYTCTVEDKNGLESAGFGNLIGTAEPGMPQLTLPIALIENKEIKQPIMCTADVGFPNGQLEWKIKPKGSTEFLPFQGDFVSKSGHCDNYVTNSLIYTPTKEGNGTLLKCEVVNNHVPHTPDLTAVADLYILPENMCDGIKKDKTIRHPFTCTKYIRCHVNSFEVKECKNRMCYDEESGRCGKTKIRMNDVVAYLNEGVTSLQCRLDHLGQWTNVTIFKESSDGRWETVVSVSSGNDVIVYDTNMKDRIFVHTETTNEFELKVNLWLYVLTCADEGLYKCKAVTQSDFKEVIAKIDLRGKPEPPKIFLPNEIIEDLPLRWNVMCQANVGYPQGRLLLKMKLQNETEFHPIIYNVTTEETIQNCSKILRKSFTFTPALRHEKMELLCEVENRFTLPINRKLVATETIHVVPRNFCLTHGLKTPQVHPYDCHQYVQCSEGYTYVLRCGSDHCFNPHTLHCDIAIEDKDVTFDPKHPCLPDKNGVFYHHPILCNKYIWCVQGQEVVHHCPLGTLYIDGGQCTFEPERSRCYQNLNKDTISP